MDKKGYYRFLYYTHDVTSYEKIIVGIILYDSELTSVLYKFPHALDRLKYAYKEFNKSIFKADLSEIEGWIAAHSTEIASLSEFQSKFPSFIVDEFSNFSLGEPIVSVIANGDMEKYAAFLEKRYLKHYEVDHSASNDEQVVRVADLLEQIRDVNRMLALHQDEEDGFMKAQYEHRKQGFIQELGAILKDFEINPQDWAA